MDDATLSSLALSVGTLVPDFNKATIDYNVVVGSNADSVKIKAKTNDKSATFSVKCEGVFGEDVKLKEGENKIVVEVTSEDGTTKKYLISCVKLPASNADLKTIELTNATLTPKFESNVTNYAASIAFDHKDVSFKCEVYDPACTFEVKLNRSKHDMASKSADKLSQSSSFSTSFANSEIEIVVTSPNKKNTKTYLVIITRQIMPRLAIFKDQNDALIYQDTFSLAPIYASQVVPTKNKKFIFSTPYLEVAKNLATEDTIHLVALATSCQTSEPYLGIEFDNQISDVLVQIPFLYGGLSNEVKLRHAFEIMNENGPPKWMTDDPAIKNYKPAHLINLSENMAEYQTKPFEKHLQIIYGETDCQKLFDTGRSHAEKYIASLNSRDLSWRVKKDTKDSPLYHLNMAIYNVASSLKAKNRDYEVHFKLAQLLEEKYYFEAIYGREKTEEEQNVSLTAQNAQARESSKEEEIDAICKIRGVSSTASDAEKLKALDQEYHHLLDTQQSAKAEQIQLLYQFKAQKSHKTSEGGSGAKLLSEYTSLLSQANAKYVDALSVVTDKRIENEEVVFHAGRSYCVIGEYSKGMAYLKTFISDSSTSPYKSLSRFYFGYAMSKSTTLTESNPKIILYFLIEGLKDFLADLSKQSTIKKILVSQDLYCLLNPVFCEAFLTIGKIRSNPNVKFDCISSGDAFRYCAWLTCSALQRMNSLVKFDEELKQSSKLIAAFNRLLIDAHANISAAAVDNLNLSVESALMQSQRVFASRECLNVINAIRCSICKNDDHTIKLLEKISEKLVFFDPLDQLNLIYLAGAKYDNHEYLVDRTKNVDQKLPKQLLEESRNALLACNEISEEAMEFASKYLTEQIWWPKLYDKHFKSSIEHLKRPPSANKTVAAAKPNTTATAAPTTIAATATAKKFAQAASTKASSKATAPANSKKATGSTPTNQALTKQMTKVDLNNSKSIKSDSNAKATNSVVQTDSSNIINATSSSSALPKAEEKRDEATIAQMIEDTTRYSRNPNPQFDKGLMETKCEFYLARVYGKLNDTEKARMYYEKCIAKEPNRQDSYIELASLLRSNGDIAGAIDVYSKFPVSSQSSSENSFDSAFIYGELVTLLIQSKKFDDERLVKYLILWASAMGLGIIEKYITILDKANKTKVIKQVYAGVHKKPIDDPDLVTFFKFKGWV